MCARPGVRQLAERAIALRGEIAMRDPDLAVRAQQAAAELERSWDRWRTMHGLGTDPLPPVSSYVGYSLEEPWGQPRVVFGIDAREAEQLAALLDRHDCAGPVYAAVASMARTGDATDTRAADADRYPGSGRVRVPTQAAPGAAPRPKPPESDPLLGPLEVSAPRDGGPRESTPRDGGPRESTPRESGPRDGGPRESTPRDGGPRESTPRESTPRDSGPRDRGPRDQDGPGPQAATTEASEPSAHHEVSVPREGQRPEEAQPGLAVFRPQHEPAGYSGEGQDPDPFLDEPGQTAEPSRAAAGWTRASRVPGGHALPRQKRAGGAAKGASSAQEG
jgi:hypothetical protein